MYSVSIISSDVKMYLESILYVCHPAALDIIPGEMPSTQTVGVTNFTFSEQK